VNDTIRIGTGAGFAGDRISPAVDLVREGQLDDIVLECLAERTIALGQARRRADPSQGFDLLAAKRMRALLPETLPRGVRIISNLGAANPVGAGRLTISIAEELGLSCRVAVVTGDDVLSVLDLDAPSMEDGKPLSSNGEVVSANAYLGAEALLPALASGAQVVLSGRVADPSLFVAPLADRFGWDLTDTAAMATGTLVGHLLECGTQITGGYFADPGVKEVPGLETLGYPFADVTRAGGIEIGKLDGAGGFVNRQTVREQLLYEISDPGAYLTPDVTLDLYGVSLDEVGSNRVRVQGASGRVRPDQLKVSVGYRAGHRAEAEISYAGPGCVERARLAGSVVRSRLGPAGQPLRIDVIGSLTELDGSDVLECRLRVAGLTQSLDHAQHICHEVDSLYLNGPAGGGGVRSTVTEVIGIVSTLVDRGAVSPRFTIMEAS
jgi:hypothetical protein